MRNDISAKRYQCKTILVRISMGGNIIASGKCPINVGNRPIMGYISANKYKYATSVQILYKYGLKHLH